MDGRISLVMLFGELPFLLLPAFCFLYLVPFINLVDAYFCLMFRSPHRLIGLLFPYTLRLRCPDGQSFLSQNEDRSITTHSMSVSFYCDFYDFESVEASATGENQTSIQQTNIVKCAAALLTAAWYPGAQTDNPATYCYIRSVRDTTLALLDGNTGKACSLLNLLNAS